MVRRIRVNFRCPRNDIVDGRLMADRIGRAGIPGQQEGLTAAAAEVDLALLTARAGLRLEFGAAATACSGDSRGFASGAIVVPSVKRPPCRGLRV
jgi:hypothetical protein